MNHPNPYAVLEAQSPSNTTSKALRSKSRWVLTGGIIAAALPVLFGAYGLHRESVYAAAQPPGVGACGMGTLGALIIMIVGGPFCGLIGGLVGWIACKVC